MVHEEVGAVFRGVGGAILEVVSEVLVGDSIGAVSSPTSRKVSFHM